MRIHALFGLGWAAVVCGWLLAGHIVGRLCQHKRVPPDEVVGAFCLFVAGIVCLTVAFNP